jgi:acetyltransferase-like isoleucine patch superfamily enzyme
MSPRGLLKRWAHLSCVALVLPFWAAWRLQALVIGPDRALEYASEWLSLWPGLSGRYLRRAFLSLALQECHPSAEIGFGVLFSKAGARIGANVYIGPRCHIGLATIEPDVLLAAGVHVTSGARMHGIALLTRPIREQEGTFERVTIGPGAWVGSACVVMSDVGAGTVVGAGAVVTRPLPAGVIAGGVPARVIRSREESGEK